LIGEPASIGTASGLILITLGLAVTFLGRKLVKVIFFIIGGLIGGLLALRFASMFIGEPFTYLIAVAAFIVAGFLFYKLLPIGAGLIAGFVTFLILKPVLGDLVMAFIFALIALVVVVILFNKLLTVGTALFGSLIFISGLSQLAPLSEFVQLALIAIFTILGCIVQFKT